MRGRKRKETHCWYEAISLQGLAVAWSLFLFSGMQGTEKHYFLKICVRACQISIILTRLLCQSLPDLITWNKDICQGNNMKKIDEDRCLTVWWSPVPFPVAFGCSHSLPVALSCSQLLCPHAWEASYDPQILRKSAPQSTDVFDSSSIWQINNNKRGGQ